MKKYSITIILLVFLSTFCLTDCEQEKKEEEAPETVIPTEYVDSIGAHAHLIELQVNTADYNKSDGKKKWKFTGQAADVADSSFTTVVGPGDRVIWVGVSSSSEEDKVEITKIKYKYGDELLTKSTITGNNGVVVGDIVNDIDSGAVAKYELEGKVIINGKEELDPIEIDPKLRIHDD